MDDLSHLPPEIAARIRADLQRWHEVAGRYSWDELEDPTPEVAAIVQLGFDIVTLVHVQVHELRRLHRVIRVARFQTAISVLALVLAAACLLRA
jgi:hypothetical protein